MSKLNLRINRRAFLQSGAVTATMTFSGLTGRGLKPIFNFLSLAYRSLYGQGGYGEGVYPTAAGTNLYLPIVVKEKS